MARAAAAALLAFAGAVFPSLTTSPLSAQTIDQAFEAIERGDRRAAADAFAAIAARDAATDPESAGFAGNNACMLWRELGEYDRSRAVCEAALALRRRAGDPVAIARTLNNYGLVLQDSGDYAAAESAMREALALNRSAGEAEAQAINLGNLGGLAALQGRYDDALALHREALALAAATGEPWGGEQQRIARVNLGVVLEKLGAFEDALDLYRRVLAGESLSPRHQADLLVNAGTAYRNLGDPVVAESFYRRARDRYRELGDRAGLASASLNLGIVHHLDLEDPAKAEPAYREALAIAGAIGDAALETQTLYYLGRLRLELGAADEASALLTRCLEVATAADSREGRWSCRGALAAVARQRGDDRAALEQLDGAISEVEAVRESVGDARLRAEYFGDRRSLYAAAVDVLFDLGRAEPGGGFSRRALAVARQAKERELTESIGRRAARASDATAGDGATEGGDGGSSTRPLLETFFTERRVVAWLVIGSDLVVFDAGPRDTIASAARDLHRALASGRPPPPASTARLSSALLGPIAGRLPDGPLLVAPDGALHDVPFALLEIGDSREPLIERHDLIYLPSAGLLAASRRARDERPDRLGFAGFADPKTGAASGNGDADSRRRQVAALPPLTATAREATTLASSLGGGAALRTGAQCTERAFRELGTAGARVVHFATHTIAWSEGSDAAAVVLAPADGDDGLLFPREIAALDLDVDLTVLAACRTHLGWREGGSGVSSLTGAFLAAGARSVIATLWDVGDQATAVFMTELYRHLSRGETPAHALRRTQLRFRDDARWRDPAIWAAFVAVGDGPPVGPPRRGAWLAAGGALVAGGIALAALALFRAR